ncbi:MAG: S41 family peptidase [Bacteroidaceae bacterium]|nr:S41 family peptidase [Bacteroidaceae bacterium]
MNVLKKILLILVVLIAGFLIGSRTVISLYKKHHPEFITYRSGYGSAKMDALMNAINRKYVDVVDMDSIVDRVLPTILEELDPHSAYYPAEETQVSNDELHGSFSGIGIQFSMQDDTVRVNSVIHGGPSEKVGVLAGDRIVLINDSVFAGKKIPSNEIVKNLKGPKGTTVKISVLRNGEPNLVDFTIERGDIPVKSVDAAYMISPEDGIGYIMINKFGETTFAEMMVSLAELSSKGMKKLIIDLRGNSGGYLGAAIQMANEFLPKNDLIVYTQGAHNPISKQYANGHGHYTSIPLAVMIDESSASAAEIFTGAIQDNDRGTVVGRRSFGKGLVQEPIDFSDGSSIRITIARYYTPSGRCIQKPYGESDEDYAMDIVKRYEHGEFFNADSIKQNEDEVYKTKGGRTVYGGGGIMPDVFVAQDTTGYSTYYSDVVRKSLVNKFSFKYVDSNRKTFSEFKTYAEIEKYLDSNNVLNKFYDYAAKNGVKRDYTLTAPARQQMRSALYGNIIYDALDMQDYITFINLTDPAVSKAIEVLK